MRQVRRIDLLWENHEVTVYKVLKQRSISLDKTIPKFVKEIIEREIDLNKNNL